MTNPDSAFDVLALTSKLESTFEVGVLHEELQLFAYLACLLSVYDGQPSAEWGYEFAATTSGSPYSGDLDEAVRARYELGFLNRQADQFYMTDRGAVELELLAQLSRNRDRSPYLEAAASSVLIKPVGSVGRAISQDPQIRSAASLHHSRPLLGESATLVLYSHFQMLRNALVDYGEDLLLPAVAWIEMFDERVAGKPEQQLEANNP